MFLQVFLEKLSSFRNRWMKTSRKIKASSLIAPLLLSFLLFNFFFISEMIIPVEAIVVKLDNAVDSDSDIDSTANIGTNSSSYTNAQAQDGTDQVLTEAEEARRRSVSQSEEITDGRVGTIDFKDGRNYVSRVGEGFVLEKDNAMLGIKTFQDTNGRWIPLTELTNATNQISNSSTNVTLRYRARGDKFISDYYTSYNKIITKWISFIQQPEKVGVYNNNTGEFTKWSDSFLPDNLTLNEANTNITYFNVYNDVDIVFTKNGTHLKEIIHSRKTSYPASPYPLIDSYLVFFTKLSNFSGFDKLFDDDGEITSNKTIRGSLKFKTALGKIASYLPVGYAYSAGMPNEDVIWKLEKRNDEWFLIGGIRYGWVTHVQRTGDIFIDPTWTIGSEGEYWGDNVEFFQTMQNQTTGFAQLVPSNTTGNITSIVREANRNWIYMKWEGNRPNGTTVDLYWNSSRDNGVTDPFSMNLVRINATSGRLYSFPIQEHWGAWRLVLNTNDSNNSPEIFNVTVFNDPPNAYDFAKYKSLTVQAGQVSGSSHTNFTLLITIYDSDLRNDVQADGDDIAFAEDNSWLDHEFESFTQAFNDSHAELIAWIRIPSLTSSTEIEMYYGNSTLGSQENPSGVWDSSFAGVWHLGEPSGDALDSTAYGIDGTVTGDVTRGQAGKIEDSIYSDGSNGNINMGDPVDEHLDFGTGGFTIAFWFNCDGTNQNWVIMQCKNAYDTGQGFRIEVTPSVDTLVVYVSDGSNSGSTSPELATEFDTWVFWVIQVDRVADELHLWKNGVDSAEDSDISSVGSVSSTDDLTLMNNYVLGWLDEVQFSNIKRSDDWIVTQFNNQNNPESFISIGVESNVTLGSSVNFLYYKEIEINAEYVDGDQAHFPILIYLATDSDLADEVQADGDDIAFAVWNTTFGSFEWTDHEIELFNKATGKLVAWVRIPSLNETVNSTVRMFYGNATMTNQQTPSGVWDNNFEAVYHFNESSGTAYDSTGNSVDLTRYGDTARSTAILSQLAGSQYFDGTGDYFASGGDLGTVSTLTFELWHRDDDVTFWDQLMDVESSSVATYTWLGQSETSYGADVEVWYQGGEGANFDGMTHVTDRLDYISYTYDGSDGDLYWQGVLNGTDPFDPPSVASAQVVISAYNVVNDLYEGEKDEVRYSNLARSAGWVNTTYQTIMNYADFFELGAEQTTALEANFRLVWEHQCQDVPYTAMDSFDLTIYGFSDDAEDFLIELWNETGSSWIDTSNYIEQSETWYNFTIDSFAGVIGSNITWRYVDGITSSDSTQTVLSIDYAGISYWNYSILLIDDPITLPSYDATQGGWIDVIENPLTVNISSLFDFNLEIRGTDGSGNPVTNEYLSFDTDSNPSGSTNLTTSYQTIYSSQTAGSDLQLTFWLFVAYPALSGGEGNTYTFTLYVRIIKT